MRTIYNGRGYQFTTGNTYYTVEHLSVSKASGKLYTDLGYRPPVIVKAQIPVIVRQARNDYQCRVCGSTIAEGTLYAKPAAKFATDKFCIDCITPNKDGDIIEEAPIELD